MTPTDSVREQIDSGYWDPVPRPTTATNCPAWCTEHYAGDLDSPDPTHRRVVRLDLAGLRELVLERSGDTINVVCVPGGDLKVDEAEKIGTVLLTLASLGRDQA